MNARQTLVLNILRALTVNDPGVSFSVGIIASLAGLKYGQAYSTLRQLFNKEEVSRGTSRRRRGAQPFYSAIIPDDEQDAEGNYRYNWTRYCSDLDLRLRQAGMHLIHLHRYEYRDQH
jgi:hypothetical protein